MDWSKLNKNKEVLMNVSTFWTLPIARKTSMELAAELITKNHLKSVLDVGANDCRFKKFLPRAISYKSLDIDKSIEHDFYDISSVNGHFDCVVMFACIEHMSTNEFVNDYLPVFKRILNPGGFLVISTNNIFHNLGTRTDLTHVQAYSPRDLNSILIQYDFKPGICFRITEMNRFLIFLYSIISKYILRPYLIDFIPEICLISQKK